MRIQDVLNSEECKPLFEDVQMFVEKSLSEYNESIRKNGFCYSDKDIFDFVWGTIEFTKAEICVLDSPLLQRLRRIRQLGLASTVYCNADSSRFSHTIGVTEIAGRMARVIFERLGNDFAENISRDYNASFDMEEVVRFAAIFHDTGHMFYSHVSELFFSYNRSFPKYQQITKARSFFCEKTSSDASLHELLSVMIVNSPKTIELFRLIAPHMKSRLTEDDHYLQLAEFISCLIIGSPSNRYILPYVTIINGAIDADKFDYLQRDSQCTRVPIAVDIARIIRKLDVVSLQSVDHSSIWEDTTAQGVPFKVMAIKNSARNVFFQLSNARSSMYESVYYHHKVLTAEVMFRDVLRRIYSMKKPEDISFCDILMLTDDAFNDQWRYSLLKKSKEEPEEKTEAESINEIDTYLKKIKNRNLYKRVAAFSQDLIIAKKAAKEDFLNFVAQDPLSEDFQRFNELMIKEYIKICSLLEMEPEDKPVFMFIYSKYNAMPAVPVEKGDGFCTWSSKLMKQDTIEAGKKSKQEQYYLVTNCKERIPVYLALEKVLVAFDIIRLRLEASICSKILYSRLSRCKTKLLEKDYYKESLFILEDEFLKKMVYDDSMIDKIVDKYQTFMGRNNCRITKDRVLSYLRQYLYYDIPYSEIKLFFNGLLQLLLSAKFLDRETAVQGFNELLGKKVTQVQTDLTHVVCLGGAFDSSNHLYYYLNDIEKKKSFVFDTVVENALKSIQYGESICFWDDGA